MSKDLITTIAGVVAAVATAMGAYAQQNPDVAGVAFYVGMAGAAGMAVWAFFTNKPEK